MNDLSQQRDEPERLDAVALVRAHLAGDEERLYAVLNQVDPLMLFAAVTSLLTGLLAESWPGGLDALDEHLAALQRSGG